VALLFRYERRTALLLGLCVGSHWVLDLATHRPDLPLAPGNATKVGLGLWNSVPGTLAIEGLLFAAGIWLYVRATTALDRDGSWGTWGLVLLLVGIYLASSFAAPPPDSRAIAVAGLGMWLFVAWAFWADRHRRPAATA
jgi:hypothetical protein